MQTRFTLAQLADPDMAESERILRTCVHCGFCNATCPTFGLLGDELDGPRGRIYLIKDMLENDRAPGSRTVKHVDRCLSCLSCMTTCPSGVNYMHLVDHARTRIEETYRRPPFERLVRRLLASFLPSPRRFRLLLRAAALARIARPALPARLQQMLALVPAGAAAAPMPSRRRVWPAEGEKRRRVALLPGCVQQVLEPSINESTIRVLARHGCEVVVPEGVGCCGALEHHLGRSEGARRAAARNVRAVMREIDDGGIDAVIVNASGCGTMLKDYGHLLRGDRELSADAERVASLARDVSEFLAGLELSFAGPADGLRVTYHNPCSLLHGQKVTEAPRTLLAAAGFALSEPAEGHLCCGSAGTYNMLQPELALKLRARKAESLAETAPDVVATGNIGCMVQLRPAVEAPVVHTVELLDWATGGRMPDRLARRGGRPRAGSG